jgi:hypothetical protein
MTKSHIAVKRLAPVLRIQNVSYSHLGRETSYPDIVLFFVCVCRTVPE